MHLSRLFEIVYLLMDGKSMSARELAEHFEVSARTIYRDVEVLSQAGIPVYSERGFKGGIRLTDNFVLDKSYLSQEERQEILTALKSVDTLGSGYTGKTLAKLSAFFGHGESEDWIEIDFSSWNSRNPMNERFMLLKRAILSHTAAEFSYSGASGSTATRRVEPMKLVFRGYAWYLLAWCRLREDFRYFKLCRMENLRLLEERFTRRSLQDLPPPEDASQKYGAPPVALTVSIAPSMAYRVRDEFLPSQLTQEADGRFTVHFFMPEDEWLYEGLMTYGGALRVLEPARIREELARRLRAGFEANC